MTAPASSPPPHPVIDVSAGLVRHAGRLLIAQRPAGSHLAGFWEFPGGKRDPGETWEACLERELREELGLRIQAGAVYDEITHPYPTKTVRLRFFVAGLHPDSPPARAVECADFAWVDRESLARYTFPPADAALLRHLLADDAFWGA